MAAAKVQRAKMMKRLSHSISDKEPVVIMAYLHSSTTSLHQAALMGNLQMLRMVLQNGVLPVDVQDSKGFTALHYASLQGNPDVVSTLLKYGARPDQRNFDGVTPLHVCCQQGEIDTLSLFLYYRADLSVKTKSGKTPFDLACEYGRPKIVQHLLNSGLSKDFLFFSSHAGTPAASDEKDLTNATFVKKNRNETTGFHLAAKNGHLEVLSILLDAEWDVNRTTPSGTALHEAAAFGQLETAKFLLRAGADPQLHNSWGQTAADVAKKSSGKNSTASKEIRTLLKEAVKAVYGRALVAYYSNNQSELSFNYGDIIWILDRSDEDRWRGVIFGPRFQSRSGYFPPSAVQLIDKQVGMNRSTSHRQVKKCNVPIVPDVPGASGSIPGQGNPQGLKAPQPLNCSRQSTSSYGSMDGLSTPTSPLHTFKTPNGEIPNGGPFAAQQQRHQQQPTVHVTSASSMSSFSPNMTSSPNHRADEVIPGGGQVQHLTANGVGASPRHRNSTGSNSSQASQASSGFESMKSSSQPHVNATVHQLRGDSPPSRNSVHSSGSSSLGSSLERLDESGYASQVNISELIMNGVPDQEVLAAWLHDLRYEEYLTLFLNAGYDLPTVARMTPEDLTAIGITKPGHRKRLTTEIHKLNIGDPWPSRAPPGGLREWLAAGLQLPEYVPLFESQGYDSIQKIMQLTWEDFEDIGIKKLGHLKKLGLAIKKLKDGRHNTGGGQATQGLMACRTMSSGGQATGQYVGEERLANGEVLVISVPAPGHSQQNGQPLTAEVRPYSHVPSPGPGQASPRIQQTTQMLMSTFQQPLSPRDRSPAQHQMANGGGYDTFPRRGHSSGGTTVLTEALVHSQSPTNPGYCSPNMSHNRPTGTVKPRPVAKIVAKTKRNSREYGGFCGSEENLEKLKMMQHAGSNVYANVQIGGGTAYQLSYEGGMEQGFDAPDNCGGLVSPRLQLSRLASPARKLGPPVPPKRGSHEGPLPPPPPALSTILRSENHHASNSLDQSADNCGLSPAPSIDELPPPPAPPNITCEEQIRNLRHIMTSSVEGGGACSDFSSAHNQHGSLSRADSASCSSSECLPFANENVGTIRSKSHVIGGGGLGGGAPATATENGVGFGAEGDRSPRRAAIKDLFPPPPTNLNTQMDPELRVGQPVQVARYPAGRNGDVLNDIGSMLQNLTDELDAMLEPPKAK